MVYYTETTPKVYVTSYKIQAHASVVSYRLRMRKKHIISLGGLPGSGKSTVNTILTDKLGYDTFSIGDYCRKMAIARGMTLEAFNELVATTKELDVLIDKELKDIEAHRDNMVIDSHLAFHFVPSSFKVFLRITPEESARRIFGDSQAELRKKSGDTMETLEEAHERTKKRILNHRERYMKHYGIDPYESSQYDLVIDTMAQTPKEIADIIAHAYTTWINTP